MQAVQCIITNQVHQKSQSIACAFILMSRRRASDYELVFRALIELIGPNYNLDRIMLDFEAASWTAIRKLQQNGVINRQITIDGCHFHYSQCIVRKIKKIGGGLIQLYNARGPINHFCRKIMALALVPNTRIGEAFEYLQVTVIQIANQDEVLRGQLQQLLDYVLGTWINGPMFQHKDWCMYMIYVRTNNHLEGSHSLSTDKSSKAATARNEELKRIWALYEAGRIRDAIELLDELTKQLEGPNPNIVDLYADPDDVDSDDVDDPQEQ